MCSSIALTVFSLFLMFGTTLNILSFTTPAWRHYSLKQAKDSVKKGDYSLGLVTAACGESLECLKKFDDKQPWEKAAITFNVMSILLCIIATIWTYMTCFLVCCRGSCVAVLPMLTSAATIFLTIGVTVYGVDSQDHFDIKKIPMSWGELAEESDFSYSIWLGVSAIVFLFLSSLCGCVLSRMYEGYKKL